MATKLTPYQQSLVDAWKLCESDRRARGFGARNLPSLYVEKTTPRGKFRQFVVPHAYKITFWASAPLYADIMRQKIAEGNSGSFYKFFESLITRSCPPMAARPEPAAAKKHRLLQATQLRNGHRPPRIG